MFGLILLAALVVLVLSWLVGGEGTPSRSDAQPSTASREVPTGPPPSSSPSPPREPRGTLLIHGTGDVSLDPSYIPNLTTYGYGYAFSGMNGLFQRDDLTVVNMECPVSHLGSPVPKEFNFECDPAALPAAKAAGVDVANMANNHAYDYGPDALLDTRKNLANAGLHPVGGGKDPAEAEQPQLFDIKGWKVAVVGIDEVVDPYPEEVAAPDHPGTACGHDVDCMVAEIRRADAVADLVVVIIHWGVELDTQPESYQVDQGHRFVDAGADIIIGGHSHRLQPMSAYKGAPIFWSLGNFVWPHLSEEGSRTAIAEVVVKPDGKRHGRLIPVYIGSSGHPDLSG
ncbi:MAG: CapA family protein [Actinomycetota bacterium]